MKFKLGDRVKFDQDGLQGTGTIFCPVEAEHDYDWFVQTDAPCPCTTWLVAEKNAELLERPGAANDVQPAQVSETAAARKAMPLATGVLAYFPNALKLVARVSKVGNEQHNPGEPLHWDKTKSTDHADCLARHLADYLSDEPIDTDGLPHVAKVAWRALALLQTAIENGEI